MLNKVLKAQNTEASEDNVKTRDNYSKLFKSRYSSKLTFEL